MATYDIYEYNGNYYIKNNDTNRFFVLDNKTIGDSSSFFKKVYTSFEPDNAKAVDIANSKIVKILQSSEPLNRDVTPENAYKYINAHINNNIYTAADGNNYLTMKGKPSYYYMTVDGTRNLQQRIEMPAENIGIRSKGAEDKGFKALVNATWSSRTILSDERIAELVNIKTSDKNFEKVKGWYMHMLDLNKGVFGFDSNYNAWEDTGNGLKPITDKDGINVQYDKYTSGDYVSAETGDIVGAQNAAYDKYYRDTYNYKDDGTSAKRFYDELVAGERAAGQSAINLADAQTQQLGMQQAAYVKNVTDQLRSERMARLRAGMSESQIASQDMQQLYANMNSLNDQIVASNMSALQGQEQINNAQYTAFQNWLNSANQMAQAGSAYSAAQAGDISAQARQYLNSMGIYNPTQEQIREAYSMVSGKDYSKPNTYTSNK